MNYATASAAFRAFLVDRWTLTPVFQGNHPTSEPDPPAPFIRVRVAGQTGAVKEVGGTAGRTTEYRATGNVIAFVPADADEENTLADIAARLDHLLSSRDIPTEGEPLRCGTVEVGIAAPADDGGRWTSVIHRIPFTYDAKRGVSIEE